MLIVTLYTKMSEYAQNTVVINRPMILSFHIPRSHVTLGDGANGGYLCNPPIMLIGRLTEF